MSEGCGAEDEASAKSEGYETGEETSTKSEGYGAEEGTAVLKRIRRPISHIFDKVAQSVGKGHQRKKSAETTAASKLEEDVEGEEAFSMSEEDTEEEEVTALHKRIQKKLSLPLNKVARVLNLHHQSNPVDYSRRISIPGEKLALVQLTEDSDKEAPCEVVITHKEADNSEGVYSLKTCSLGEANEALEIYRKTLVPLVDSCGKDVLSHSNLQKVLKVPCANPTWNVAHIMARFGFLDALKNEEVLKHLNICEEEKGQFPLHIAVENESEKVIAALVAAGASLDVVDKNGNTPMHVAALKSVTVMQALNAKYHPILNKKNAAGETPLLLASKCSKLDNIKLLIKLGANVNHKEEVPDIDNQAYWEKVEKLVQSKEISRKDLMNSGNLLHWVKTQELVNLCLDMGCDPNFRNTIDQTALHVMVIRGRVECVVALLCRGADASCTNPESATPLHLAAAQLSSSLVQALVVFGGDVNAVNKKGETPRHVAATCKDTTNTTERAKIIYILHAVGGKRCPVKYSTCTDGCLPEGNFNGVPPYEKPFLRRSRWLLDEEMSERQISESIKWQMKTHDGPQRTGRVLCLDGGGIRGLCLTQMLSVIQEVMGQPIHECFDWISGTSTGGFLALMICLQKQVKEVQSLYYRLKSKVFVGGRPYESGPLEKVLMDEFGEETVMSSIKSPRVMVTTTLADRLPADLHFFRNYESPMSVLGVSEDEVFVNRQSPETQKIWKAARCSGAAPSYFRAFEKFIDGGLVGNNPVLDTLTEIEEWNMAVRAKGRESEVFTPTVVVSLGTGKAPVKLIETVDLTLRFADVLRSGQALQNLCHIILKQACSTEGRVVDRARTWCSTVHVPYFRFNPQLVEAIPLDETNDENLVLMMWETRAYMKAQARMLVQLKPFLVEPQSHTHASKTDSSSQDVPDSNHILSGGTSPDEDGKSHSPLPEAGAVSNTVVLETALVPESATTSDETCSSPEATDIFTE